MWIFINTCKLLELLQSSTNTLYTSHKAYHGEREREGLGRTGRMAHTRIHTKAQPLPRPLSPPMQHAPPLTTKEKSTSSPRRAEFGPARQKGCGTVPVRAALGSRGQAAGQGVAARPRPRL